MTLNNSLLSSVRRDRRNQPFMFTLLMLQVYLFLVPLELVLGKLFGVETIWKPYRVAAILAIAVAAIELPYRRLDRYDQRFLAIFLTACALSAFWVTRGITDPFYVFGAFVFALIAFSMYLCIKLSARGPQDLARLVTAFVLGALVDAGYSAYEAISLGHAYRPAGLSGAAPENLALHSGLAFAFVLYPFPGSRRSTWVSVLARTIFGAVLCFSVILSGTRAAWLGLVVSAAVLACVMALSRSQRGRLLKVLLPVALLVTGASAFNLGTSLKTGNGALIGALEERVWSDDVQTGAGRLEIWRQAANVASDYDFVGGGFSGFMQATSKRTSDFHTFTPEGLEHGVGGHNVFLETLIDYGPSSLLLLLGCLATLLAALFHKARDAGRLLAPHGMLFSVVFLLVCGLFRDLLGGTDFWIIMAFATLFVRYQPHSLPLRSRGSVADKKGTSRFRPAPCGRLLGRTLEGNIAAERQLDTDLGNPGIPHSSAKTFFRKGTHVSPASVIQIAWQQCANRSRRAVHVRNNISRIGRFAWAGCASHGDQIEHPNWI